MGDGAFGLRWFWHVVLGIVAATTAVLITLTFVHQREVENFAAAQARAYQPPAATLATRTLISVVGDSYTGGSDMNSGTSTLWWSRIGDELPVQFQILAAGGSGYATVSTLADKSTFEDRASKISPNASEVIFFGSRNDAPAGVNALSVAARASFAEAKKVAPKAKLIVIGPPWVSSDPPAAVRADRDALKRIAADAGAVWVDPIADDWFPTGSKFIGSDGVHPNDDGHAHLEELIKPIVQKYLPKS